MRILNKLDPHTAEVVRKSSASILVKILGMGVGLLVSLSLGRLLGADGLGVINLSHRIQSILLVFTAFGMANVTVKKVAIGHSNDDWQSISNVVYSSFRFNGLLGAAVTIIGILSSGFLANEVFDMPELENPLIIIFVVVSVQTVSRVHLAALKGLRKVWQVSILDETLGTWLVGLILLSIYLLGFDFSIFGVALTYAVARFFVMLSVTSYWKSLSKRMEKNKPLIRDMLTMALPLLLVSATFVISSNIDTVMLGWLCSSKDVGLYTVSIRLAMLMSFFLQVSNSAISPKIAALYAKGKTNDIAKMVKRVTLGLTVIGLFGLLFFISLGEFILSFWGSEFIDAYQILVILAIGQFFNTATGCSGLLLIMSGHEKIHGYISVGSIVLNLTLNYFLIVQYGPLGAAIATAITIALENIVKVILSKKMIGITPIPFT